MHKAFYKILVVLLAASSLVACEKNRSAQPVGNGNGVPGGSTDARNVYVACEGSFGNGNASLFVKDLNSQTEYNNVYQNKNGTALGDVFQSMERIGDKLFMCVNNSDKVVVLNANTYEFVGELNIPKPRYILPLGVNKAYVSTLYSNKVYIIDPEKLIIKGNIEMPHENPEGMALFNNTAYICTWDTACSKVYLVNTTTDKVVDAYAIAGAAPHQVALDKFGAAWILSGNVAKGKTAALTRLAPGAPDVMQSYQFKQDQDPIRLVFNQSKDALYFIGTNYYGQSSYNGVFKMDIGSGKLPATPFVAANGIQYYWGLGVDPVTDEVYVGDPKGFVQNGSVSVYDASGNQLRTFGVGVGPSYFYFDE